jgi:hypothetical protein
MFTMRISIKLVSRLHYSRIIIKEFDGCSSYIKVVKTRLESASDRSNISSGPE